MTLVWVPSSKCSHPGCVMTLCTPIGAGLMLCWLHILALGLPHRLDPAHIES